MDDKPKNEKKVDPSAGGYATAALVLSILGVFAAFIPVPIIGLPIQVIGLVFGCLSLKSTKKGQAIAAIILCITGILLVVFLGYARSHLTSVSGDDAFMSSFKSSFVESCERTAQRAPVAYCTCAENYLIANNSESQLEDLFTQLESGTGQIPQKMIDANSACAYTESQG